MTYFQHKFDRIEDYLHHRPPYLLIKEIVNIGEDQIETSTSVDGSEFFIQGHFPGAPILPGALMQEMTTQTAGVLIAAKFNPMEVYDTHDPFFNEYALGVLVKVNGARFRGFARPGDSIAVKVKLNEITGSLFDFSGEVCVGSQTIMKNSFRLSNILSSVLQGEKTAS
ncbi:MAG: hypothetical protein AAF939_12445 [Planctomycetota bacterium]